MQQFDVGLEGQHLVHFELVVHRFVPVHPVPSARIERGRAEDEPLFFHDRQPVRPPLRSEAFHQPLL